LKGTWLRRRGRPVDNRIAEAGVAERQFRDEVLGVSVDLRVCDTGDRTFPQVLLWVSVVLIKSSLEVVERGSSLEPAVAPVEPLVTAPVLALVMSRYTTACTRDSEAQEWDQGSHGRETQARRASCAQRRLTSLED
jgi:hypothetical protein